MCDPANAIRADARKQPAHQQTGKPLETDQFESGVFNQNRTFQPFPSRRRFCPNHLGKVQGLDLRKVEGTVEVVEPLGGETHIHINFKGVVFIAKAEGRHLFQAGQRLRMAMNLNHLHLFDADSGQAIY